MNIFEWFTPKRKTWLYDVNPAVKFGVFFTLFIIIFFNSHNWFVFFQMVLAGLLLYLFSGYDWKKLLLFTLPIVITFVTSTITMILFGRGENVWWQWGIIKISEESFYKGLLLGFKATYFAFMSFVFLLTSRPIIMFYAFMQQFKLPPKYAYSFIAAFRIVPIVVEEIQTRTNALKVRGMTYSKGFKGIYERLRLYSIPLFAQSIRRAQRLAVAMEAKRFQIAAKRTYFYETTYTPIDAIFLFVMIILTVITYLLTKLV